MPLFTHRIGSRRLDLALTIAITLVGCLASAAPASASFTQQATLTASDEIGKSLLGSAVALSPDGNLAVVGGPQDDNGIGAAWVFVRKGSTWTEQAKLTGIGETDKGKFGTSVALSSNGRTALIGGPGDNENDGAAWVFTRSGSTWTQQGEKLTGKDAGGAQEETHCDVDDRQEFAHTFCFVGRPGRFGESVALSSNGRTALIGGPGDNENDGAAWVFTRSGSTWTQQGEKLTGIGEKNFDERHTPHHIGGRFGESVALSANGDTAVIGGPLNDTEIHEEHYFSSGAAWTFTRSGSNWMPQGNKFSSPGSRFGVDRRFGQSVALSAGGEEALVGAPDQSFFPGLAEVFARNGLAWSEESEAITAGISEEACTSETCFGESRTFGVRVALSAKGDTALIGSNSFPEEFGEQIPTVGARVFVRSGSTWTQQSPPLNCGTEHCGVALSGDASTALLGPAVYMDTKPTTARSANTKFRSGPDKSPGRWHDVRAARRAAAQGAATSGGREETLIRRKAGCPHSRTAPDVGAWTWR